LLEKDRFLQQGNNEDRSVIEGELDGVEIDEDEHEDEPPPAAALFELLRNAEEVFDWMPAVERRDGDQVEKGEENRDEGKGRGQVAQAVVDRNPTGGEEDDEGQKDIGQRPSEGDEGVVTAPVTELGGIDRDGFAPADESEAAQQKADGGNDDGAEQVDVGDRIESESSLITGGVVAEHVRGPGVCRLMEGEDRDEHQDEENRIGQTHGVGSLWGKWPGLQA